jgi:hypothetical protein
MIYFESFLFFLGLAVLIIAVVQTGVALFGRGTR